MTNGADRLDQIEAVLLRVARGQEANTDAIAALTARMDQAAVERAELRADAEADRKMIWAAMQQHDVTIARIDRILDYLFGQQRGNGHDDHPQA